MPIPTGPGTAPKPTVASSRFLFFAPFATRRRAGIYEKSPLSPSSARREGPTCRRCYPRGGVTYKGPEGERHTGSVGLRPTRPRRRAPEIRRRAAAAADDTRGRSLKPRRRPTLHRPPTPATRQHASRRPAPKPAALPPPTPGGRPGGPACRTQPLRAGRDAYHPDVPSLPPVGLNRRADRGQLRGWGGSAGGYVTRDLLPARLATGQVCHVAHKGDAHRKGDTSVPRGTLRYTSSPRLSRRRTLLRSLKSHTTYPVWPTISGETRPKSSARDHASPSIVPLNFQRTRTSPPGK